MSYKTFLSDKLESLSHRTISEIQVTPIKPRDGLVGFASLVFNNDFYLGCIGIFTQPQGGYRLTYPTRKVEKHNINIFHPINKSIAQEVEQVVIAKFEEVMKHVEHYEITAK